MIDSKMERRDQILAECWIDVRDAKPAPKPEGKHFPVTVLGVIDDRVFRVEPDTQFVDIVSYWPALDVFTVTYTAQGDEGASDFKCRVTHWQPQLPLPLAFKKRPE